MLSKKQMQNLGFYLPVIRDGFKWSLEELGNRLGVSKQTIANIEKQARNNVENSVTNEEVQIEKEVDAILTDMGEKAENVWKALVALKEANGEKIVMFIYLLCQNKYHYRTFLLIL